MIVYWVAAIETLIYLSAIPLHIAIYIRATDGFAISAGFSLFEKRFARKRAFRRLGRAQKAKRNRPSGKSMPRKVRLIIHMLRHLKQIRIHFRGTLGLGDAASTALIYGSIQSLKYALHPFYPNLRLDILPDFNGEKSHAEIQGMISVHTGQIIYAALSGAVKNANRRVTQWISIRLKAS